MIANLLQCDVMLLVMQTVLKRALNLKAKTFSESHLQKVLHLIGYAVQEEESNNYEFFTFHDSAAKWGILPLIEELVSNPRVSRFIVIPTDIYNRIIVSYFKVATHNDLIVWTIQKYKETQKTTESSETMAEESLLPKEKAQEELEKEEKAGRAKLAAERRAKILAQMANAQNKFMTANAELYDETRKHAALDAAKLSGSVGSEMDWQLIASQEIESAAPATVSCLGPLKKKHISPSTIEPTYISCILCSEESVVSKDGPCMVYSAFIQKSSVLSRYQKTNDMGQLQYLETAIHPSPHTGTCGHVMHATCWQEYFNNEIVKETRRPYRNRSPQTFDVEKKEFLCPLCRCLSNGVMPVTPELWRFTNRDDVSLLEFEPKINFEKWLMIMKSYISNEMQEIHGIRRRITLEETLKKFNFKLEDFQELCEPHPPHTPMSGELQEYIRGFMDSMLKVAPYPSAQDSEPYLVPWMSCAYTIESLEMLLRAVDKPLKDNLSIRHTCCLSGLIRFCGVINLTKPGADVELSLKNQMNELFYMIFELNGMSVLQWDVFGVLISLLYITPTVIYMESNELGVPKGDYLEYYILKLMFLANIARIITVCEIEKVKQDEEMMMTIETEIDDDMQTESVDDDKIIEFYRKYNLYTSRNSGSVNKQLLINEIKKQNQTFLRCSCLLFHFMTDIELPSEFEVLNGDTFELMCDYLGLSSNIETYFNNTIMNEFMSHLVSHPYINNLKLKFNNSNTNTNTNTSVSNTDEDGVASTVVVVPVGGGHCSYEIEDIHETIPFMSSVPPIRQLVALPDDYSDLINSVSLFTCPNNDRDDSRNPTMCLVCGEILCSQTYCCQKELMNKQAVGACTYHAQMCGAGVGMFLRIRECEILLLTLNKGCFVSPPYLDEYGETDQGLQRGNPLTLTKEIYKKLHLMWLGHGLYEEIARSTEKQSTIVTTQWQHL